MNRILIKIGKITAFAALAAFTSCSDDVLDEATTNVNNLDVSLFDSQEELVSNTLIGLYKPMQSQGLYSRWLYFLEDYTSDEVQVSIPQPPIQRIADYGLDNDTEANNLYWDSAFTGIRNANTLLATLENLENPTDFINSVIAEVRFLRGHYLFLVVSRFGGVPLNFSADVVPLPRTTFAESMQAIIDDFAFAAENLGSVGEVEQGRPSNETAYAYLGKAQLFSVEPQNFGNSPEVYEQAFNSFSQVQSFSLVDEYDDNFNYDGENNPESIFEIPFTRQNVQETDFWSANIAAGRTDITFRSVEYSSWGNGSPTSTMLSAYEDKPDGTTDPRMGKTFWFPGDEYGPSNDRIWGQDPDSGRDGFGAPMAGTPCTRKFSEYIENTGSLEGSGINFRIIRYADVLLMQAEAALFKNTPDIGLAMELCNQIRRRASVQMPDYPTADFPFNSVDEAFRAIVHERRVELAMEGKRTVDLGRWGLDEEVLAPLKPGYNSNKRFFPIPNTELVSNPNFGADNPQ